MKAGQRTNNATTIKDSGSFLKGTIHVKLQIKS